MKTSLTIVLAAAALTIGTATVAPISSTAFAGGGGPDKWCGAAVCPRSRHSQERIAAISSDRHAGRSSHARRGRLAVLRYQDPIQRRITNWMNNDPW